jgi:hypothetical protein
MEEVQRSIYERSVSEEWKLYRSPIGPMLTQRRMAKKVSRSRTSPSVPESATDDRAEIPNPESRDGVVIWCITHFLVF